MQNDYSGHVRTLFVWYDAHRRDLPWRKDRNPYTSWISEVMLQQTRVDTVIPYYERFLKLFPDIRALAAAGIDDIYKAWEGLGYYSRAANLSKGAKYLVENYDGVFPKTAEDIRKIPGIGPYIAAAILSMAYGEPEPSVDGNLIRVISRLNAMDGTPDDSSSRKAITAIARDMIPADRPGDFNEAMMDIGATICTPKSPACEICPFHALCTANKLGTPEMFPGSRKAASLPAYPFTVCVVSWNGSVWVQKRPSEGLLAGLYEFPMFPGHLSPEEAKQSLCLTTGISAVCAARPEELPNSTHRFSHMIWDMKGYLFRIDAEPSKESSPLYFAENNGTKSCRFVTPDESRKLAFPTALRAYTEAIRPPKSRPG